MKATHQLSLQKNVHVKRKQHTQGVGRKKGQKVKSKLSFDDNGLVELGHAREEPQVDEEQEDELTSSFDLKL